jgi:hypothetical protein
MISPDERSGPMEEAYRQLVLHLEIPGITTLLLDAQEERSVRQAGIAIQSKLTEHIRSTDHQRSWRRAREYYRKDARRERMAAQLSDPHEYMSQRTTHGSRRPRREKDGLLPRQDSNLPAHTDCHPERCMADPQAAKRTVDNFLFVGKDFASFCCRITRLRA